MSISRGGRYFWLVVPPYAKSKTKDQASMMITACVNENYRTIKLKHIKRMFKTFFLFELILVHKLLV